MLGDLNPQTIKIDQQAVVYPGRDHVTTLTIKRYDGRSYRAVDTSLLTRVVLVFPDTDPTIAYDSNVQPAVFDWTGSTITIDLSDYAMPASSLPCYLIAFDAEHPAGQVLVDNEDTTLEFDFRNISTTGSIPAPAVEFITDAPMDGETYGRKDGAWVTLDAIVSGVVSVNGMSGIVVLDAADVGADPTGTAAASMAAHVAAVDPHPQYATDTDLAAHVADTTPHADILSLNRVGFNMAAGLTAGPGEMVWNATDATMDLGLPGGVTLQAGQEFLIRGLNNSGVTMLDGQAVYISGASGNRTVFSLAQANQPAADKTIGILTQDILNNQEGFCTLVGMVRNFNTLAWAEGSELWLSATTPGGLTNVQPAAPANAVRIGYVVRSHASIGTIFVRVQHLESLKELHDVVITAPADGDIIEYDSTTMTWINVPNTGGSGEANTASNVGAGNGVFAQKVGVDLQFKSLVAGAGITLTPAASTITITGGGGSGAVDSVNGQTGVVVLDTDDIGEGISNLYFTNARASAAAPVQMVDGQTGAVVLTSSYAPLSHVGDVGAAHGVATTVTAGFMSGADKAKLDGIAPGAQVNVPTNLSAAHGASTVVIASSTGDDATLLAATATEAGAMTAADKTKLDGIATGATANQSDAFLLARANHTGTQTSGTISDFTEATQDIIGASVVAGTNITVSYNDGTGLTTIASTGGGATLPVVQALSSTRNLALVDNNTFNVNSTTNNYTVTILPQSSVAWLADTEIHFLPSNTGDITITGGTGVSVNGVAAGSVTLSTQNGAASIKRIASDSWWVGGAIGTLAEQQAALGLTGASLEWTTYGGTANAITLAPLVARSAYVTGDKVRFRATTTNTGATTINVSGLGAKTCVTVTGAALPAGYIRTGVDTEAVYDGTNFVVRRLNESGSNANGEYVRFVDGTQICMRISSYTTDISDAFSGGFRSSSQTWTFPMSFISAGSTSVLFSSNNGFGTTNGAFTSTSAIFYFLSVTSQTSATRFVSHVAIGRWY